MGGIIMVKKAIAIGIVSLFVIGGFLGIFSVITDEVEAPGPTFVSGIISVNTTWTVADSPYIVIGNTLVEENYTLSIEPGVEVKFDGLFYIQIDGRLVAEGNESDMIIFTSNQGSPGPGDWLGLKITNTGDNSVIKYCIIEYAGPGIDNAANNLEVSYCSILNNSADWGGIYNSGSANIHNNTLFKNYADLRGGGIWNEGTANIRDNLIFENSAGDGGGGIYNTGSVVIEFNIIYDNFANSDCGGGVYNYLAATAYLDNNVITDNSAYDGHGGGVGNYGWVTIVNCTIKENNASQRGGGVFTTDAFGGSATVLNSEILRNSATFDNSGGIYGPSIITYSLISNNTGWGIFGDSSISNSTLVCNSEGGIKGNPTKLEYNNIIHSNLNINLTASSDVYAYYNWWGTTNKTIIDEKIYDYYDHFSLGKVFYLPRLTEPSPDAPEIPPDCGSGLQLGAPWPMFRGNVRHTGLSPYDTSGNNGGLKWSFYTGNFITMGNIASSPIIDANGTIYIGSEDGVLYAINSDGTEKWNYTTGSNLYTTPAIGHDGTIYISTDDNLFAINPNGTKKWQYTTLNNDGSSPVIGSDGTIYIGADFKLFAFNPNGTVKWSFFVGMVNSSPAIGSDGTIYLGSYDHNLYAIYPNGTKKWSFLTGDVIMYSSPAIASDGTIYIGSQDNNLYAVNPNGTEKWSFTAGYWVTSSPSIGSDGSVYFGSDDNILYAVYPNGTEKWAFTTMGDVWSSPAIGSDGTIYIGSEDNKIYAIKPDGILKWNYPTGGRFRSSPAIDVDGTIYIWSYDFYLYAIGGIPNQPPVTPPTPSGPISGETNISYSFSLSTTDPEGNQIKYGWDWDGDGTVDEWSSLVPSGTEDNRSHSWSLPGIYNIKVKAQDEYGNESGWSNILAITITSPPSNQPPNLPPDPSGPISGETNISYSFSTSTTDPEGDQIKYGWDWDGDGTVDEWSGLVPSGTEDIRSHSWSAPGIYNIKVKVQDEHGSESMWSNVLSITITSPDPGPPLADSQWPKFRGNMKNTGLSPYDTSGNKGEFKWSFETDFYIKGEMAFYCR
jgi:outer membrane protein assembly factor BamB